MIHEEVRKIARIMIVDDDAIHNTICAHLIRKVLPEMDVKLFTEPLLALDFIKEEYSEKAEKVYTLLLLDINMPKMTGWEFLDVFKNFHPDMHEQFIIYILSSSVDKRDKQRAEANPFIDNFISKPLTLALVKEVVGAAQLEKT